MDEAKRAELIARRTAILERAAVRDRIAAFEALIPHVPMLAALEGAGEEYKSHGFYHLHGALNDWAHEPYQGGMVTEGHARFPEDPALRDAMILARLREHVAEDQVVTVIMRRGQWVFELALPVLARHLATLVDNAPPSELGFAAPPADWFVEVTDHGVTTGRLLGPER